MLNLYCNVTRDQYVGAVRDELIKIHGETAVLNGEKLFRQFRKTNWTFEQLLKLLDDNKIEVLYVNFDYFLLKNLIKSDNINIVNANKLIKGND